MSKQREEKVKQRVEQLADDGTETRELTLDELLGEDMDPWQRAILSNRIQRNLDAKKKRRKK